MPTRQTNQYRIYLRTFLSLLLITSFTGICLTCCNIDSANGFDLAGFRNKWRNEIKTVTKVIIGNTKNVKNQPEFLHNTNEDVEKKDLIIELETLGTVGGGVVGDLIGKDKGRDIGASVGSQAGKVYAEHLYQVMRKHKDQADTLEASVTETKEINELTREYNDSLYNEIRDLKEKSDRLDKQITQGKINEEKSGKLKEQAIKEHNKANKYLEEARLTVNEKRERLESAKQVSGKDVDKLEKEISELETHIAELERNVDELASIDQKHGTL